MRRWVKLRLWSYPFFAAMIFFGFLSGHYFSVGEYWVAVGALALCVASFVWFMMLRVLAHKFRMLETDG